MSEIKPSDRVCFNCAYGVWHEQTKQVVCHLMPPNCVLAQIPNPARVQTPDAPPFIITSQALPPFLQPDWWCSKFAPKAAAQVKL